MLTVTKSNLVGPAGPAGVPGRRRGGEWLGEEAWLTPDEVTGTTPGSAAARWLDLVLRRGPKAAGDVKAEAAAAGLTERTLWRAKRSLAVVAKRYYGQWYWCLPGDDPVVRFAGLAPLTDPKCHSEVEAGPAVEPRDPHATPAELKRWARRVLTRKTVDRRAPRWDK